MKFNFLNRNAPVTTSYAGAEAFVPTPELELYAAVATTMLNDSFYEKGTDRLTRIKALVAQVNPVFVAKLAVYVREKMYLRSAPVILTGELAKHHNGDGLVAKTIGRVIHRPDEIMELLAYYQLANERKGTKKLNRISKQMQKGLATVFNKFDEYQFAKYNGASARKDADVKLRDALFLVHPKAKDDAQQAIFDKIVTDSLATPYTWETELSALGQQPFATGADKEAAFRATWEALIDSNRLGYMAMLRNLRNLLEAAISPAHLEKVAAYLANEGAVLRAKQLPFRFLAAYRELKDLASPFVPMLLDALEDAVRVSVTNLRGFAADTRVVVACDVSGSMQQAVSSKSKVLLYDIGLLLAMLLKSKCRNVQSGMFGDVWKTVTMPSRNVLANVREFYQREGEVGYSTNGFLVIKDLIDRQYVADKVMLFTDCQLWDSVTQNRSPDNTLAAQWTRYKQLAPNAKLYLFDLAGHGQLPLRVERQDVYLIAGWSDKVFDVLDALEDGQTSLAMIDAITL